MALAGNVDLEALCDKPVAFTPNGRGKGTLHFLIVALPTTLLHCSLDRAHHRIDGLTRHEVEVSPLPDLHLERSVATDSGSVDFDFVDVREVRIEAVVGGARVEAKVRAVEDERPDALLVVRS